MYATLYKYLLLHHELPLPGVGTFTMERKPANFSFADKEIKAPSYHIVMTQPSIAPATGFFTWLATQLKISDREAIVAFNNFAFQMKDEITKGAIINWQNVGKIENNPTGELMFSSNDSDGVLEKKIIAHRILREHNEHAVLVGEKEKTSDEMIELLDAEEETQSNWWLAPLIVGLTAFVFLAWYFSQYGLSVHSTSNTNSLEVLQPVSTYHFMP